MEETGAASRGRAARLPLAGRGGRRGGGGRRREGGAGCAAGRRRRAAQGGRRGGPSPPPLHGPTSPSKNQVAMKSDREDRVYVVLPSNLNQWKSTLLWALLNVAKNGERLFIVHVHRHKHISPKALEKLGEYVSMCNERKVSCVSCSLQLTKNDDVAKELAELIDRHSITKLVMRGAAGKRYSEGMKSLEFKLKETAPLTCKIWFTWNGQLKCAREANATVPAIQPPPVGSHALKMAEKKIHTGRASDIKYQQGNIASHTKAEGPSQRSRNERGAKKHLPERKDKEKLPTFREKKGKEKSYQPDLKNAEKEKLRLEKQIEEVEHREEIARNEYFLQEPVPAVTEAGGLYEKNNQQSAMTLPAATVNTEFSEDEIEESIKCLGNTLIGKGGSGSVYKGCLRNTVVAIKKLHSMQEEADFIQMVGILGRVRHPNLVTLIGVCSEEFGLVYEFLPNDSLQDQLVACRNGMSSPLKWQVCIKIIREIWMVLTFLHRSKPPLVHGNLKASKVLLDSNFTCKLEASCISQSNGTTSTTEHDDVHSFGIIALQLLMMCLAPENDAIKVVDEANKKGELDTVLNTTAWSWPPELAKRLAHIGLQCVGRVECRPDEAPDDLAEEVRQLFVAADGFAAASQEEAEEQAPRQFKCPLSQGLMVDPHIAEDKQTYEREYIKTWLGDGNATSPVTREVIAGNKLILNQALKSMIEDWQEKQQRQVRTTLTVCDPNPVQSSLQSHPTIPPAAQSQHPTGLHPDPVTSRSLTPLDASAEAQLQLFPASSSPPTGLRRRRHVNGSPPLSSSTEADVPGPSRTLVGKLKHE